MRFCEATRFVVGIAVQAAHDHGPPRDTNVPLWRHGLPPDDLYERLFGDGGAPPPGYF